MKRRKNVNKYSIGRNGQITNNQPKLSTHTQKALQFLAFAQMFNGGTFDMVDEDENESIDTENGSNVEDDVIEAIPTEETVGVE